MVRCGPARYAARSCDHLVELPSLRRWLQTSLRDFQPDLVHAHLFQATVAVATLPRRPGERRLVTHHHGSWLPPGPRGRVRRVLDEWANRRYDRVVAVSSAVSRYLIEEYRYPPTKVVTIPNGWEGEPLQRPEPGERPPTVVCVAGLRREKGHDLLVSAFASVREQVPDSRLVLVGDGDLRPALVEQVKAAGLADSVQFAGMVDEVWPYLAEADVFALASRSETFGMAIVEAMAAGLPVVAPATGGILELVVPGQSGELFAPGDVDALAAHIVRLLRSPELRLRMGKASQDFAESFRMETTVRRYFELYESLLPGVRRGNAL